MIEHKTHSGGRLEDYQRRSDEAFGVVGNALCSKCGDGNRFGKSELCYGCIEKDLDAAEKERLVLGGQIIRRPDGGFNVITPKEYDALKHLKATNAQF